MKILFITGHPYLPQIYGGLQTSTNQLCQGLKEKGHQVAVLSALTSQGWIGSKSRIKLQINKKISGCKISKDSVHGYSVWRTWFPWESVEYVAAQEKPDVIVVLAGEPGRMALAAQKTGIPILLQLQNVELQLHGGDFETLGAVASVANSQFTAEKYRNAYNLHPAIIYPFMNLEKYRTETSRENVTFINPVPEKGRDIACEVARLCPDIPFTFVEGWPLSSEQRRELMHKLSSLPNVAFLPPQKDMRRVYGKCKILLVPSIWEEAYGMVATEAQASGIPVIASKCGGLPEAVGRGGLLVDPEGPIDNWVKAVRKVWQDEKYYAELSVAAFNHAQRPEMNFAYQIDAYEKAFMKAAKNNLDINKRMASS